MFRKTVVVCLLMLVPHAVRAQEEKTAAQLDKELQVLKGQLQGAVENLTTLMQTVAQNTEAINNNRSSLDEMLQQQRDLLARIEELTNLQQEQFVRQQTVLDSIVQKDSSGSDVLNLSANMQKSDEFRQQVQRAVHDAMQQEGQVIVRNKTDVMQRILINQKEHDIPAGEFLTLSVPVGTLTAQLPGQPYTNWAITAPSYEQKIDIVPQTQTVTAARPIDTSGSADEVTALRPLPNQGTVYVDPPVTYYVDPLPGYWYWWSW